MAATLDQVSGGRAIPGLGIGHGEGLEQGPGVVFEKPVRRMREYVSSQLVLLFRERHSVSNSARASWRLLTAPGQALPHF
jgi:alkanesulfonate monooxygenase SsuD/methylene tetrahydromethanopterin reductase-like flavin-dependent oxidoreductase (luciferase family)